MPSVTIKDKDKGAKALEAVVARLADPPRLTIGVHADTGEAEHRGRTKASVLEVAVAQEFAPGRSWLRSTIDEQRARIEKALASAATKATKSAIFGKSAEGHVERAFGRVVERFANQVKTKMSRLGIRDTGHLRESVEGRVDNVLANEGAKARSAAAIDRRIQRREAAEGQ